MFASCAEHKKRLKLFFLWHSRLEQHFCCAVLRGGGNCVMNGSNLNSHNLKCSGTTKNK